MLKETDCGKKWIKDEEFQPKKLRIYKNKELKFHFRTKKLYVFDVRNSLGIFNTILITMEDEINKFKIKAKRKYPNMRKEG